MYRASIPILGLLLVGASGIADGIKTGRWSHNDHLLQAAQRLDRTPQQFGEWTFEPLTIDPDQLKGAEASGGISGRYQRSSADGAAAVEMMMLCGPFGPIAVHPPTVCFRSIGYRQCRDVKRVTVEGPTGEALGTFWSTEFERTVDGVPERLRTWWGWTTSGTWSAPTSARFEFAGSPYLFKLYITEKVDPARKSSDIPEFAAEFLPRLQESVFKDL